MGGPHPGSRAFPSRPSSVPSCSQRSIWATVSFRSTDKRSDSATRASGSPTTRSRRLRSPRRRWRKWRSRSRSPSRGQRPRRPAGTAKRWIPGSRTTSRPPRQGTSGDCWLQPSSRRSPGHLAASFPVLRPLGRTHRSAHQHRGRCPGEPDQWEAPRSWPRDWPIGSGMRFGWAPRERDRPDRRRRRGCRRGNHDRGAPGRGRDPTGPGCEDQIYARLAAPEGPADAEDADGLRDQVHGDVPRAVLAGRRA